VGAAKVRFPAGEVGEGRPGGAGPIARLTDVKFEILRPPMATLAARDVGLLASGLAAE
jgi:hypothetical protein